MVVINKDFKVSIFCMVYNHEPYLKDCIEGFLMQKCNFNFEIVVGEDCSSDRSREILLNYQKKNPGRFKLLLHKENIGALKNQNLTLNACDGKYIALCEGDDYWTDPLKLQKQVDFLEQNLEFSFCFHDTILFNQITGNQKLRIGERKIDSLVDLRSVIYQNNIPTASLLFRNILNLESLPDWFFKTLKCDYALVVILAEKGLGKYMKEVMSVYRIHNGGIWSSAGINNQIMEDIRFYQSLLNYYKEPKTNMLIQEKLNYIYTNKGLNLIRTGRFLNGLLLVLFKNNYSTKYNLFVSNIKILSAFKEGILYVISKMLFYKRRLNG